MKVAYVSKIFLGKLLDEKLLTVIVELTMMTTWSFLLA